MNIDRFIRWVVDNFFIFLFVIYGLSFAAWFFVSPIDGSSADLGTFAVGRGLFACSAIFLSLRHIFAKHNVPRVILSAITALSLGLTGVYLFAFMPEVKQIASYNENIYLLTYHHEFLGNGEYRPLLAKWDSSFHHSLSGLGETCCTLRLAYDPSLRVVSVVELLGDSEILAYSDSDPPRIYERDTRIGNSRYYPAWDCYASAVSVNGICDVFNYTVYRCTLENTGCTQLPFRYSGDYAFEIEISQDEQSHQISIYFWIGDYPGVRTWIFTYGDDSSCHVAGCQLLTDR